MKRTLSLTLPREVAPVFPDWCIVCGREHPDHRASLFAAEMRRGHSFFSGSYSLQVPCCTGCAFSLHARRIISGWAPLLIVICGLALFVAIEPKTKSAGPIAWFTGAFGIIAFVVWRVAFPPLFSVEPHDTFIVYEFRDVAMAEGFRRVNPRCDAPGSLTSA